MMNIVKMQLSPILPWTTNSLMLLIGAKMHSGYQPNSVVFPQRNFHYLRAMAHMGVVFLGAKCSILRID
jgi:hypothetical protein